MNIFLNVRLDCFAGVRMITTIAGMGMQSSLLATICSTTDKVITTRVVASPGVVNSEESHLLHAYLTERAVRDSLIKQHQCHDKKSHHNKVYFSLHMNHMWFPTFSLQQEFLLLSPLTCYFIVFNCRGLMGHPQKLKKNRRLLILRIYQEKQLWR